MQSVSTSETDSLSIHASRIARFNGLSRDRCEVAWLLGETTDDPADKNMAVPISWSVDCIRLRLSKTDRDEAREREERERIGEYNRLVTDRVAQANLIKTVGLERAKARMLALRTRSVHVKNDASGSVMCRFGRAIERVFEYFRVKNMKMEPFQLELVRGVLLGIAQKQFGDALYKYKHALLSKLYLAPLGSESYDYNNPSVCYEYRVEQDFARYANPYTLCLAPRQCGKSLMMCVLLASVLLHLEINIMVQAQNKHMCSTLLSGIERSMVELQELASFSEIEKLCAKSGNPENRVYKFDRGYKGPSYAHFLASSNDVSILFVGFFLLALKLYTKNPHTSVLHYESWCKCIWYKRWFCLYI